MFPFLAPLLALASKLPAVMGPVMGALTGINFQAIGTWIATNWRFILPIVLILVIVGESYGWHHEHSLLVSEKASHALDIKNYRDAQAKATADAEADKLALEEKAKADAKQADANYAALLAKYRANLVRFKAAQSRASKASNSQLPTPQSGNGSSPSTNVPTAGSDQVVISMEDAQVCAANTARLKAVQEWANQLKDAKKDENKSEDGDTKLQSTDPSVQ